MEVVGAAAPTAFENSIFSGITGINLISLRNSEIHGKSDPARFTAIIRVRK